MQKKEYMCSPDVDLVRHWSGGCALCDDSDHLPEDLISIVDKNEKVAWFEATKDLRFKVNRLIQNFKDFKHHMTRVTQQELH